MERLAEIDEPGEAALVIRQMEPRNFESPFHRIQSYLTPTDLFYVRSHFKRPEIDTAAYRLQVDGAVRRPLNLSYGELREMPAEQRVATLECAGNGRVYLQPQAEGAQWGLGAVGTAEWTGVRLWFLLEKAGLREEACEVLLAGADSGVPKEKPVPPGEVSYARSIPLTKAQSAEVLIAYQMNGRDLTPDHGYPVRAIVPGHYGMASVKWLSEIRALSKPFHGYFQTSDYAYWGCLNGQPVRRPLRDLRLKSQIARPRLLEVLAADQDYLVTGAAWSGEIPATHISFSADGGQTWKPGEFIDPIEPFVWRRWQFQWRTPVEKGKLILCSRASDANGTVQPDQHDPATGSYVINHVLPLEVTIG